MGCPVWTWMRIILPCSLRGIIILVWACPVLRGAWITWSYILLFFKQMYSQVSPVSYMYFEQYQILQSICIINMSKIKFAYVPCWSIVLHPHKMFAWSSRSTMTANWKLMYRKKIYFDHLLFVCWPWTSGIMSESFAVTQQL